MSVRWRPVFPVSLTCHSFPYSPRPSCRFRPALARSLASSSPPSSASSSPPLPPPPRPVERGSPQLPRSNEDRIRRSFREDLFAGIGRRLARERAERERAAALREAGEPMTRWSMTLCLVGVLGIGYYMGTYYPVEPEEHSTLPLSGSIPPEFITRKQDIQPIWTEFIVAVGRENVSTDPDDMKRRLTSAWSSHQPAASTPPPFCVVYPRSTEEVVEVVQICHSRRIPLVAFSAGTSLEGQTAPTRRCVCIDLSRMNRVLEVHPDDLDVVVQPGVAWDALNELLAPHRLFFPPDPGPGAHIGGMIATGCSGTNAYRYGPMRQWVIGLTVVLADGTVIHTRRRPRKSSAGYDLTRLFVGSEGTLGIITEATLRLTPVPRHSTVAICSFPTLRNAAACAAEMVTSFTTPLAAIELLDDATMAAVNAYGGISRPRPETSTLFLRLAADDVATLTSQASTVRQAALRAGASVVEIARPDSAEVDELWAARKEAFWATLAARPNDAERVWTTDVAVPLSRMPDLIEQTKDRLSASGLFGTILGHAGDGNFHLILCYADHQRKQAEDLVHEMVETAIEMEGTSTGEHGVGLVKRDYLAHELGQDTVDAMRRIKQALDPLCVLNCDKVIQMDRPTHINPFSRTGSQKD